MKKTKCFQIFSFSLYFSFYILLIFVYILNVTQLKHRGFIWNEFNWRLNEENKRFSNSLFLSLPLFLVFFFFFLILFSIYISMREITLYLLKYPPIYNFASKVSNVTLYPSNFQIVAIRTL
jgi:hypothetical protein